jgi:hypothetical protein
MALAENGDYRTSQQAPLGRRGRRLRREVLTAGSPPKPSGVSCPRCGGEDAMVDTNAYGRQFEWWCLDCGYRW